MKGPTYEVRARARNIRLLFLVDILIPSDSLAALMCENQKKWGGRSNPIIPVIDDEVDQSSKNFAKNFDPDIIYYSTTIGAEFAYDFARCIQPALLSQVFQEKDWSFPFGA